ncbi:hypothetical protein GGI25_001970 [Coemansia spiralis]|uniref:Uncharacterized protein n=2 Tax=Coemansia TaxID=4863 RepID=A0A9W8KY02_9FUNG|nr:hypothetical protein BX070DRAFT_262886 [Coemansia spiralis]KAJ1993404.1 hypothetical protein EDC05_002268 [Coemansia umbellata]KAJ2623449.1 hypothetical protein GGI26_002288 [Coemansia sp. RSA 1358]KAJ2678981.1 hypothetical protein GGI25_001970 [Coemansia spiralis]
MRSSVFSFLALSLTANVSTALAQAEESASFSVLSSSLGPQATAQCDGSCTSEPALNLASIVQGIVGRATQVDSGYHIIVQNTPIVEMIYNYMNPEDTGASVLGKVEMQASDASQEEFPSSAILLPASTVTVTVTVTESGDEQSESTSVASSAEKEPLLAATAAANRPDVPPAAKAFEIVAPAASADEDVDFDYKSWSSRIDAAAHKLASNVGGIIVSFLPNISPTGEAAIAEESSLAE